MTFKLGREGWVYPGKVLQANFSAAALSRFQEILFGPTNFYTTSKSFTCQSKNTEQILQVLNIVKHHQKWRSDRSITNCQQCRSGASKRECYCLCWFLPSCKVYTAMEIKARSKEHFYFVLLSCNTPNRCLRATGYIPTHTSP